MECPNCQREIVRPDEGFDPAARIFMCPFCVEPMQNPDYQAAVIPLPEVGMVAEYPAELELDGLVGRTISAVERRQLDISEEQPQLIDVLTLTMTDGSVIHLAPDSTAVATLLAHDARYWAHYVVTNKNAGRSLLRHSQRAVMEEELAALQQLERQLHDGIETRLVAISEAAVSGTWTEQGERWPSRGTAKDDSATASAAESNAGNEIEP